ncbi:MarR family winged helix-turn-helix transcriptional regulator [Sphingosinithalassobacter sp. CS137]|uniref:MarR family winged helix-turn-helix transcriptional regulator n=1 Tax=Sphingosinithalassobacter sp. CS137 TaxID=2762748 RepID=UPI00165D8562|nr:MarR family winged helix-turn-helix transcriptional regulator [Sphingosinithalassobacter sp. CS137]
MAGTVRESGVQFPNVAEELDAEGRIRLERFIPALITQAAHRLAANNSAVYRDTFDVTLMEWRVMLHLVSEPGASAAQVAQTIGYDKASISRTVASLARRDLLEERSNPADGRSSRLFLNAAGLALYERIVPVALAQEAKLLGDLTRAEAETLLDLIQRVAGALRSEPRRAGPRRSPTKGVTRHRPAE